MEFRSSGQQSLYMLLLVTGCDTWLAARHCDLQTAFPLVCIESISRVVGINAKVPSLKSSQIGVLGSAAC